MATIQALSMSKVNQAAEQHACVCAMTDCRCAAAGLCDQSVELSTLRTSAAWEYAAARRRLRFGV